jgi:hypothetical protein
MLRPPWKLTLHLRAHIETAFGEKEYITGHSISRDASGAWNVVIERGGKKATEMSGEGDLPAIIEADGAIVILLPQSGDHIPPSVPTSSESDPAPPSI